MYKIFCTFVSLKKEIKMFVDLLKGFVSLIYPKICGGCGGFLVKGESNICTQCKLSLSKTAFHTTEGNDAEKLFWNKVPIKYASAYCYFHKGGIAQKIIHNIKYKGYKNIGIEVGHIIGEEIKGYPIADVDIIVPVPLHPSKLKKRRYNQSEVIAIGISDVLGVGIDTSTLVRARENETQTKKNVSERYENSLNLFAITDSRVLENKRVLLVDDVITTGATLEACARELLKIDGVSVNCVTFAISAH